MWLISCGDNAAFEVGTPSNADDGTLDSIAKISMWHQPRPFEDSVADYDTGAIGKRVAAVARLDRDRLYSLPSLGTWMMSRDPRVVDELLPGGIESGPGLLSLSVFNKCVEASCRVKLETIMQGFLVDQTSVLTRMSTARTLKRIWERDFRTGAEWHWLKNTCIVQCCYYQCRQTELEAAVLDEVVFR